LQKLLFLTDLHLTAGQETIIGLDPAARMKAVLDAALAAHPDAAALILMGDLAHRGEPAAYAVLKDILAPVGVKVIPMIGNHDRREAFLAAFPDAPQSPGGFVQAWVDLDAHRIITLDTLDGPPYADDHHAGHLCPERLAFLDEALRSRAGRHAVVCMHHPPFDTGVVSMDQIGLTNGDEVMDLLSHHGNLSLMCGHLHLTVTGVTKGVPWTVLKSPCHQGVVDLVSLNAHLSTDAPGSYALGLLGQDRFVLHHVDVDDRVRQFGGYGTDDAG